MDSTLVRRFWRRMQGVAKLFRFVELFIALAFLSWLSSRLPFAVRISGEYCRRFSLLIFSPISIFLLGNVIVLTLLAKSGLFSGDVSSSIDNAVADLYDELRSENPDEIAAPAVKEEVVFQDKEIICEENSKTVNRKAVAEFEDDQDSKVILPKKNVLEAKASYKRSKSENLRRESEESNNQKLRRSETDIRRKEFSGGGGGDAAAEEVVAVDDDLSNEEFQQTIEAFIAKQIRFHRQERLAVVLHGQA